MVERSNSSSRGEFAIGLPRRRKRTNLPQCSTRIRVGVADETRVSLNALRGLAIRGVAVAEPRVLHVVLGPNAPIITAALQLALTAGVKT